MSTYLKFVLVAALIMCGARAIAADVTGYVAIASDYVKRGVTQSDGDPAVQLGVDFAFTGGFFAGAWGSTIDIDNGQSRRRDNEVNYYVGYTHDVSEVWRVTANVVAYRYPGQTGGVDYNYLEYSAGLSFDDRFWLEYSLSPDLYNTGLSSRNVDSYLELPVNSTWAMGGGVGYYDTSKLTGSAYWYWHLGATGSFKYVDVDVRFHDSSRSVFIISTPDRAAGRVALTVRFPF